MRGTSPPSVACWTAQRALRQPARRRLPGFCLLMLLGALMVSGTLAAQAAATSRRTLSPRRTVHTRRLAQEKPAAAEQPVKAVAGPAIPVTPPAPEWPVNDPPERPTVSWNGHELRVDAMNASLQQTLREVAADTGAQIAGFRTDQRIFGVYGPGAPREVLAQLLDGTGYNVIIVGSQGEGTPVKIVLSIPSKGSPGSTDNQSIRNDQDVQAEEPVMEPPPVARPGMNPGQEMRTPQQMYQQMMQRREQDQGQQFRQPEMPPENPPQ